MMSGRRTMSNDGNLPQSLKLMDGLPNKDYTVANKWIRELEKGGAEFIELAKFVVTQSKIGELSVERFSGLSDSHIYSWIENAANHTNNREKFLMEFVKQVMYFHAFLPNLKKGFLEWDNQKEEMSEEYYRRFALQAKRHHEIENSNIIIKLGIFAVKIILGNNYTQKTCRSCLSQCCGEVEENLVRTGLIFRDQCSVAKEPDEAWSVPSLSNLEGFEGEVKLGFDHYIDKKRQRKRDKKRKYNQKKKLRKSK